MAKSLTRILKVGFSFAVGSQPFHYIIIIIADQGNQTEPSSFVLFPSSILLVLLSKSSKNDKNGRFSVTPVGTTSIVIVGLFLVTQRVSTSFVGLGPKLGVLYIGG